MSHPIATFPLRVHAHTSPSFFEQIKQCFNGITHCVIDVFKKIGEFFYGLFHAKPKPAPTFQAEVLQLANENPLPTFQAEVLQLANENPLPTFQAEVLQPANENPLPEPEVAQQPIFDIELHFVKNLKEANHPIVGFYLDDVPNDEGLTFDQILNADDNFLEQNDHWIDWVFPTTIQSLKTPAAPVLNYDIIPKIRASQTMRNKVLSIFRRVLRFYGLREGRRIGEIERDVHFPEAARNWLTVRNYNFLRITQIIHSLGLMIGRPNVDGARFFHILENISLNEGRNIIGRTRFLELATWRNAIEAEIVFTY